MMIDLQDLLNIARAYQALGGAVQQQLDGVVDGESLKDMNPNALQMIKGFLAEADDVLQCQEEECLEAGDLAEAIDGYLENLDEEAA